MRQTHSQEKRYASQHTTNVRPNGSSRSALYHRLIAEVVRQKKLSFFKEVLSAIVEQSDSEKLQTLSIGYLHGTAE